MTRIAAALMLLAGLTPAFAADTPPPNSAYVEGDYVVKNFKFTDGETLPELRLHYATMGKPVRDAKGRVTNAVIITHGTGGTGQQFLRPQFADVLFAPGGLLDPAKYFIILPDGIGHGKSSKPSDGLHAKFPHYDYDDMVRADYELLTKGLKVNHLRLAMGTSMGCMHSFVWGEMYPTFMDALMPLACQPVQIAGRNRMWRKMTIDGIRSDPAWMGGEYKTQPIAGLRTAVDFLLLAGQAPLPAQNAYPTRDKADAYVEETINRYLATIDANDFLYQVDSSRNYDPSPKLSNIVAPVMWVNSADDFINPPELGIAETKVKELKHGKFVLIPISPDTHGHGTHTWAVFWKQYLEELLKETAR
ncbi:MAG: alpha/beta fold hydrolase [Alphaproteobacteria bacterium]|nr:alpha/beta fold hydrolase [Alphaproteobacteria bacterium]